ncbi:DUF998 domain-containing protein [Haloarcula onubensis]|uniref:DUF998 domain-containing protein n=1 Tax=Haloarcula onubensis TaxID=2950539 RepID=A0ABU2FN11_9EURY|nr:DUF998 domain-containing protein [Halomicroarcula sp. S3CR25-11]MDS0281687.1 DUF998 domain-containing protein [Halomicroarcula sp. S3CR25-11]
MDDMPDGGRVEAVAGFVAVAVAAVGIGGGALASPAFSVAGNALSDLGQPGNPAATPLTTLFFDGGLVVSGVIGLAFTAGYWQAGRNWPERVATLPLAIALAGMAGVGLFPAGQALHAPAALTLYLGSMVAMALDAVGVAVAGLRTRAAATLGLVFVHVAGWWWWAGGGPVLRPGLAIPELLGAAVFAAWVVWTAAG